MTGPYDWSVESARRLFVVTVAAVLVWVAAVALAALGTVLAVTGRPAGLTLLAVAATVAAAGWWLLTLERNEQ